MLENGLVGDHQDNPALRPDGVIVLGFKQSNSEESSVEPAEGQLSELEEQALETLAEDITSAEWKSEEDSLDSFAEVADEESLEGDTEGLNVRAASHEDQISEEETNEVEVKLSDEEIEEHDLENSEGKGFGFESEDEIKSSELLSQESFPESEIETKQSKAIETDIDSAEALPVSSDSREEELDRNLDEEVSDSDIDDLLSSLEQNLDSNEEDSDLEEVVSLQSVEQELEDETLETNSFKDDSAEESDTENSPIQVGFNDTSEHLDTNSIEETTTDLSEEDTEIELDFNTSEEEVVNFESSESIKDDIDAEELQSVSDNQDQEASDSDIDELLASLEQNIDSTEEDSKEDSDLEEVVTAQSKEQGLDEVTLEASSFKDDGVEESDTENSPIQLGFNDSSEQLEIDGIEEPTTELSEIDTETELNLETSADENVNTEKQESVGEELQVVSDSEEDSSDDNESLEVSDSKVDDLLSSLGQNIDGTEEDSSIEETANLYSAASELEDESLEIKVSQDDDEEAAIELSDTDTESELDLEAGAEENTSFESSESLEQDEEIDSEDLENVSEELQVISDAEETVPEDNLDQEVSDSEVDDFLATLDQDLEGSEDEIEVISASTTSIDEAGLETDLEALDSSEEEIEPLDEQDIIEDEISDSDTEEDFEHTPPPSAAEDSGYSIDTSLWLSAAADLHEVDIDSAMELSMADIAGFQTNATTNLLFQVVMEEMAVGDNTPIYQTKISESVETKVETQEVKQAISAFSKQVKTNKVAEQKAYERSIAIDVSNPWDNVVGASLLKRVGSFLVDGTITIGAAAAIALITFIPEGFFGSLLSGSLEFSEIAIHLGNLGIIACVCWIAYSVFQIAFEGRTLGQKMFGLRVTNVKGESVGAEGALLRSLSQIACFLTGGISMLPVLGKKKLALHDRVSWSVLRAD